MYKMGIYFIIVTLICLCLANCKISSRFKSYLQYSPSHISIEKNKNGLDHCSVTFSWPDGQYSPAAFKKDFGNIHDYQEHELKRSFIVDQTYRLKILKKRLISQGGIAAQIRLKPSGAYIVQYNIKFDDGYDFGLGGKLPGLAGGRCNIGGNRPLGDGWSVRLMWDGKSKYFFPYVYHFDQPGSSGENMRKHMFTFTENQWYTIKMYVKMNSGRQKNGILKIWINHLLVFQETRLRYVTQNSGRQVDTLLFHIFHGGNTRQWMPGKDQYVYLDNFKIQRN